MSLSRWAEIATIVGVFGACIAAGAALWAVFVARRQLGNAARADRLAAVAPIFAEYRTPKMRDARKVIMRLLTEGDRGTPIGELPEDVQDAAQRVGQYLDQLGILVQLGLVEVDQVAAFLGISALAMWRRLKPYIDSERKQRNPDIYLNAFEALAVALVKANPELKARRLERWCGDWDDQ